jgi:hypothetical protein
MTWKKLHAIENGEAAPSLLPEFMLGEPLRDLIELLLLSTTGPYYIGQFCSSTNNSGSQGCFILVSSAGDHPLTFLNWVACHE